MATPRRCWMIIGTSLALFVGVPRLAAGVKTYVNQQRSYTLEYPSAWYFAGDAVNFEIYSFPASLAVKGLVLPQGGQGISLFTPADLRKTGDSAPKSLDDWSKNAIPNQRITGRRVLRLNGGNRNLSIVEVRAECCGVSRERLESFQWYFEVDGRMFCASGGHRKGEPNTDSLLRALEGIVLSVKVSR